MKTDARDSLMFAVLCFFFLTVDLHLAGGGGGSQCHVVRQPSPPSECDCTPLGPEHMHNGRVNSVFPGAQLSACSERSPILCARVMSVSCWLLLVFFWGGGEGGFLGILFPRAPQNLDQHIKRLRKMDFTRGQLHNEFRRKTGK